METPFLDAMRRARHDALRRGEKPTHWLLNHDMLMRFDYEATAYIMVRDPKARLREFEGLPIYIDRDLDEPGWILSDAPISDRHREAGLIEELERLQMRYQKEARPIIKELTDIAARKPPSPMIYRPGIAPGSQTR